MSINRKQMLEMKLINLIRPIVKKIMQESATKNQALSYLKKIGANSQGDLNYTTENGVDFYIGLKDTTAIVVAIVESEDNYMLYKEDMKEMSSSARTKGIKSVELHTNFGMELHSTHENPKSVGFDKIVKKSFG